MRGSESELLHFLMAPFYALLELSPAHEDSVLIVLVLFVYVKYCTATDWAEERLCRIPRPEASRRKAPSIACPLPAAPLVLASR